MHARKRTLNNDSRQDESRVIMGSPHKVMSIKSGGLDSDDVTSVDKSELF